jgi:acyl-coenzyme A thioesterase PaaI-like protein
MSAPAKAKRTFWDLPEPPSPAVLAKRRLAGALRDLTALCVTSEAPEDVLVALSDEADAIAARLRAHPARRFRDAFESCKTEDDFAPFADRSVMTGRSNPLSPPMSLKMEGSKAVSRVTFGAAFEGVPGHVHGGIVSAALDETLGYLAVNHGIGGLTAVLTVRFRAPTPMEVELRVEASVLRNDGRKTFVEARMLAGEVVTADAEAVFVAVDRERMLAAIDSANKARNS